MFRGTTPINIFRTDVDLTNASVLFIVHLSELSERKRAKQKTTCYAGGGTSL